MQCSKCPREFEAGYHSIELDFGDGRKFSVNQDLTAVGMCPVCLQWEMQTCIDNMSEEEKAEMWAKITNPPAEVDFSIGVCDEAGNQGKDSHRSPG